MSIENIKRGRPALLADPKTLGGSIRLAREQAGYRDQKSFAKLVGISRVSLSRIENNVNKPTPQVLHVINEILGTHFKREDIERAVELPREEKESGTKDIPYVGKVAAGKPVEIVPLDEFISVPRWMLQRTSDNFALVVQGDSMRDALVQHGDILVISPYADLKEIHNHQLVVVDIIGRGGTVKTWTRKKRAITLIPANPDYQPEEISISEVRRVYQVTGVLRAIR